MLSCSSSNPAAPTKVTQPPPQNLRATGQTEFTITLEWGEAAGATNYVIYQDSQRIGSTNGTRYIVMKLGPATTYDFSVQACGPNGCSDATQAEAKTGDHPGFFTISYSNMAFESPITSTFPTINKGIFNSQGCDPHTIITEEDVTYSIDSFSEGLTPPNKPGITLDTGEVNKGSSTPGVYVVTVKVKENDKCSTNVLVYHTITPADKAALKDALESLNGGIERHGPKGNFNYIIISNVKDMSRLFRDLPTTQLPYFNGDISEWDTSNVTNMASMFSGTKSFNQPIENWKTSNVTDMSSMFSGASKFNQPIGEWDTSKVIDMNTMFNGASIFNQPIGNWKTSNVTDMGQMFKDASAFNQSIGEWDTSKVEKMVSMFSGARQFNQPIGNWQTSNVTQMNNMFNKAIAFDQPLSNWNTSKVGDMGHMFDGTSQFDQAIGNWNVSGVANMSSMFQSASAFNQPLSNWDTSKVEKMVGMFALASEFNQPLNSWETSNVTDMEYMFLSASKFNQPLSNWNTSKVEKMGQMFKNATVFSNDLSGWNVDSVTTHTDVFIGSAMEGDKAKWPEKFR